MTKQQAEMEQKREKIDDQLRELTAELEALRRRKPDNDLALLEDRFKRKNGKLDEQTMRRLTDLREREAGRVKRAAELEQLIPSMHKQREELLKAINDQRTRAKGIDPGGVIANKPPRKREQDPDAARIAELREKNNELRNRLSGIDAAIRELQPPGLARLRDEHARTLAAIEQHQAELARIERDQAAAEQSISDPGRLAKLTSERDQAAAELAAIVEEERAISNAVVKSGRFLRPVSV